MLNQIRQRLQSRQHAGSLLAEKFVTHRLAARDAIALAIPQGGIPIGHELALILGLPFEVVFSKRIRHPAHSDQSIGAVSLDEVSLQESTQFIPQSYVLNQISMLQRELQQQFQSYYGNRTRKSLREKTVLLVDDVLRDTDELSACLHVIERQEPSKIIVTAAIASLRVINFLEEEDIEFHYLFPEISQQSRPYTYFPPISEEEARNVVRQATASI
jgi:predicted phosphoribosyltransferase